MTKILLDTNAYTAFMAGDQHVLSYMVDAEVVYISTIVIGELFAGFYGGDKVLQNKEELKTFLSKDSIKIIDVTMETAEIFGELKSALARKGRMIPLNDIWIAAHAIEYGSKLITYDEHFKNIDGVRIWEYLN
ncbi:MAG: PIN domain-containing protein [Rectinema subterraneum]|jgi:tRNA(fMet)-specific endonuclease VapC